MGHWSSGKERFFKEAFQAKNFFPEGEEAVVFITLGNRALDQARAEQAGYPRDSALAVRQSLERASQGTRFAIDHLGTIEYQGGTNESDRTPMIVLAYRISS